MKLRQLLIVCIGFMTLSLQAQDVHFSYYQFAPSTINPALTGAFYGNIRATALMRGQWSNVRFPSEESNNGFSTRTIFLDGNIPFGLKKGDWISAGLNILMEGNTAGVLNTKRGFSGFSVAYHLTMGKKQSSILTAGLKYGSYSLGFQESPDATTPNMFANQTPDDEDLNNLAGGQGSQGQDPKDDTNDFHFGLMLTTPMGKNSDLRIGLSMDHLLAPRFTQAQTNTNPNPNPTPTPNINTRAQLERRINFFAQFYTQLNAKLTWNPSLVYIRMGPANNILVQSMFSYQHNPNKDIIFNFGVGARLADNMDIPLYLGVDYKDWRVGLAFDTNLSGLAAATSNAGGFEIGISKIFKWNKKAAVNPKFICPRL